MAGHESFTPWFVYILVSVIYFKPSSYALQDSLCMHALHVWKKALVLVLMLSHSPQCMYVRFSIHTSSFLYEFPREVQFISTRINSMR